MAGHHLMSRLACPNPFNSPKEEGGKKPMQPLSIYAMRFGQCCRMLGSRDKIALPPSSEKARSQVGSSVFGG
jgi:hypothetical protein